MNNFNVGDMVIDLTDIDKWRDPEMIKDSDFIYHFNKEVLMTDGKDFIIKSKHPTGYGRDSFSDNVLFSQASGLSHDKSRVLFNLTPHIKAMGVVFREQSSKEVWDQLDFEGRGVVLKNAFLTYFDRLHEEIKPSIA